jgi:hypothetical protein
MNLREVLRLSFQYTHVQAFIVSALFSCVLFLLTRLAGLDQVVAAAFATYAGLMTFLISERQFVADRMSAVEKNILTNLQNRVYARRFEDADEAIIYISQNAASCKKIYNTRFRSYSGMATHVYDRVIKIHDNAIAKAVHDGCEYNMIVDIDGARDTSVFQQFLPMSETSDIKGRMILYSFDTASKPIIQMTILIFKDGGRECLVGWDVGGNTAADMPVLHFRDSEQPTVTDYFLGLFKQYQIAGRAIISPAEFEALLSGSRAN